MPTLKMSSFEREQLTVMIQYGMLFLHLAQDNSVSESRAVQYGQGVFGSSGSTNFSPFLNNSFCLSSPFAYLTSASIFFLYFGSIFCLYSGAINFMAMFNPAPLRPAFIHTTTDDVKMATISVYPI